MATLDLARRCGLNVTQARLQPVGQSDVLMLLRFDRNHALLRKQKGWRQLPAYDLVPAAVVSLKRRDVALTVGDYGRTARSYNLLSQAGRFGLSAEAARGQIDSLVDVVRQWRDSFFARGVSAEDIDCVEPAMLPDCFFFERRPDA